MVRKCRKAKDVSAKDGIGVSSTYMQLRSRRIVYVRSENSSSVVVSAAAEVSSSNLSPCCASNEYRNSGGLIDLEEERDGDTETSTYRRSTKRKLFENLREKEEPMENSPAFLDSAAKDSSGCCCSGRTTEEEKAKSTTEEEQPTEAEIEDFFVEAEKKLKDTFKKKYNFDFEKEKPLEGRYEWVKLSE